VLWLSLSLSLSLALLALALGQLWGAGAFALLAAGNYCYLRAVRHRLAFASAVIAAACAVVKRHRAALLLCTLALLLAQLLWLALWGAAAAYTLSFFPMAGRSNNATTSGGKDEGGDPLPWVVFFLMAVSLYWGKEVVRNVGTTTVSGTVACWWFQPERPAAVKGSLFRCLTTSFGSICLGSLLVSIVQALRETLNMVRF
jgi:hypothetical protein